MIEQITFLLKVAHRLEDQQTKFVNLHNIKIMDNGEKFFLKKKKDYRNDLFFNQIEKDLIYKLIRGHSKDHVFFYNIVIGFCEVMHPLMMHPFMKKHQSY